MFTGVLNFKSLRPLVRMLSCSQKHSHTQQVCSLILTLSCKIYTETLELLTPYNIERQPTVKTSVKLSKEVTESPVFTILREICSPSEPITNTLTLPFCTT